MPTGYRPSCPSGGRRDALAGLPPMQLPTIEALLLVISQRQAGTGRRYATTAAVDLSQF